ncbi:uncharacterized protein GGS22DRAFT_189359 [Annulohypoxylon maeteangense]|uniref:uncharacterized protein n=1 Tax=Annulohypoxylon maeteangense TaxID=1927788 RepID=UPI002007F13B|nr:uncharacterized protein GGS22DRAFT_189359 [Annulohypoxylon maeteangense]KAI0884228.1 hypothetical protein GGS22DRAFT_189359 [Annulohypoxylon maeteangense]
MAVIELVFPKLKKDPELIKQALSKVPGLARAAFKEAGVQRGLRGFIDSENGKDVTSELRELVILEWLSASDFTTFIESSAFVSYMEHMKPYADGPPELDLFETNIGSPLFGPREFLEIILVRPKNVTSLEDVETILKKVKSSLEEANDSETIYGASVNLSEQVATIIRTFASREEREAAKNSQQELLSEIGKLAVVTRLNAEVKQLPI